MLQRINEEKIRNKQRCYNKRNEEKIRNNQKTYDSMNKAKVQQKQQKYDTENKEKVQLKQRMYDSVRGGQIDERARLKEFKIAVRNGPIFPCSSCHRLLFRNGVRSVSDKFKARVNDVHGNFYNTMVTEIRAFDGEIYLCHSLSQKFG